MKAGLAALALGVAVMLVYVALGGGGYAPDPVADPCRPRELPRPSDALAPGQRMLLTVLDRSACELGTSREQLALALLEGRLPPGVDGAELIAAFAAGLERRGP